MYYTDFTVEMTSTEMLDKALQNSTPKKYARLLLEGAEIIKQLRRERDEARSKEPMWIPAKENPPDMENSDWVIGVANGKRHVNAITMVYYDRDEAMWHLDELPEEVVSVSHWMPLPELPEVNDDD